jgi:Etoposide-induced protein 2.4 (EI24)
VAEKFAKSSKSSWLNAIGLAIGSQFHPKMLSLLFLPWLVALLLWALIGFFAWTPITQLFSTLLFGGDSGGWVYSTLAKWGFTGAKDFVANSLTLMLLVPLAFASAMVFVAVFAMPAVIRYLSAVTYRDVARQGDLALAGSMWNALRALLIFIPGYILTIPLWFVPIAGLLVPWLWWAWLNARVMRFDSLAEHATPAERTKIVNAQSKQYGLIALVIGALNYIPPLFLLTPVLSALAFAHFSLSTLRSERSVTLPVTP